MKITLAALQKGHVVRGAAEEEVQPKCKEFKAAAGLAADEERRRKQATAEAIPRARDLQVRRTFKKFKGVVRKKTKDNERKGKRSDEGKW